MSKTHSTANSLEQLGLHHLRALNAILVSGSVTKAADELGVSQSALSHQLSRMREVMQDPLVVRSRGGVVATPRAQALAEPLKLALEQLEKAIAPKPVWEPATARQRFRLGVADHYAPMILTHVLPRLSQEAPGIDIDLRPQPAMGQGQALEEGELDLAGSAIEPAPENLRTRPLFTSQFACAVSHEHPDVGEQLDLDTFCRLAHVFITPGGSTTGIVDKQLAQLGRKRRVQVTIPYFLAAPLIVATSNLILTGPKKLLQFMAERVPLRVVEPPKELALPTAKWGLLWHERVHFDDAHRWFRKLVAQSLRAK